MIGIGLRTLPRLSRRFLCSTSQSMMRSLNCGRGRVRRHSMLFWLVFVIRRRHCWIAWRPGRLCAQGSAAGGCSIAVCGDQKSGEGAGGLLGAGGPGINSHAGLHGPLRSISYFFGLQLPLKIASLLSLNFRELLVVENSPWPASVKSTVSPALGQRYKTR